MSRQTESNQLQFVGTGGEAAAGALNSDYDQPLVTLRAPILVVDDEEANLAAMRDVLRDLGQPIVCASSGEDALRLLLDREFALILLDVLMPGMNGYETAEVIRSRQRTRDVPIIFLSAMDRDKSHMYRGYTAGAVDYVFKPVEPQILRSKVSVFVELYIKIQEVRRQAEHEKKLLAENLEVKRQQSQTAKALKRTEAQQSLLLQSLPIALYVSSVHDGFQSRQFIGGNTEHLCGLPPDSFSRPRKVWLSRIHEDDRDHVLEALEAAMSTGSFFVEYRWRREDDTYGWFYDRGSVMKSATGTEELFGIWLDVSERRNLEQQLAHAQKLETLGRMTGGIAHDFNNMLSVILGSLGQVESDKLEEPKIARRLDLAIQAAHNCADMTNRLLGFARRQSLEPIVLSLDEELGKLEDLLSRTLGHKTRLELECSPDCWTVYLDKPQLEAALMNLAINARDAMPDGGVLKVSACNRNVGDDTSTELDLKPGPYVELRISDTGTGMCEEVQQKAFEPFFTTKGVNKGTGLGLSTTYGFVKQSGGTVTIESSPGEGTSVSLFLPRAAKKFVRRDTKQTDFRAQEGDLVLVVEDDERVREVAVTMLETLGYSTIQAGNASEALELLRTTPGISLLFSDCIMPGELDGEDLAAEAARLYPDLPVLLTSAYRAGPGKESENLESIAFLPKPYTAAQLVAAIQSLADAGD